MSFTYDNRNCESFGLYVERYPDREIPAKKMTTYDVPGRSGRVYVAMGGYENVTQVYKVYVKDASALQGQLSKIVAWLLKPDEPVELRDSYDANTYRMGIFTGGTEWANSLNQFGKTDLSFDCWPQRYAYPAESTQNTIPGGTMDSIVIGTGMPRGAGYIDDIRPIIKISGTGTPPQIYDNITLKIKDTITNETTEIRLESTATCAGKIVVDCLAGTMYLEMNNGTIADVTDYFDVTISGELQRKFTYQVRIDDQSEFNAHHIWIDPRWYKL